MEILAAYYVKMLKTPDFRETVSAAERRKPSRLPSESLSRHSTNAGMSRCAHNGNPLFLFFMCVFASCFACQLLAWRTNVLWNIC